MIYNYELNALLSGKYKIKSSQTPILKDFRLV